MIWEGVNYMIYVTGDCHGDYRRFSTEIFPEQKEMTKDDFVIICGDFGFWDESGEQRYWRRWLSEKPFTTLWVDGNHENYDLLKRYPAKPWKGGMVQVVAPGIIHLMRGQIYELDGLRFFTFGGARSHDITGGILEPDDPDFRRKKKALDRGWEPYRINHISWWKEEMPDEAEMEEGIRNLDRCGWKVDLIISHCCATSVQKAVCGDRCAPDRLTDYFEMIEERCEFGKWVFGHYHENRNVDEKFVVLYEQIVRIK